MGHGCCWEKKKKTDISNLVYLFIHKHLISCQQYDFFGSFYRSLKTIPTKRLPALVICAVKKIINNGSFYRFWYVDFEIPFCSWIAVWKVFMGWQPSPNLAPWERKSRMKETPCRSSRLPLSDSEISLLHYDDFRATGVCVTLELHKGEGSSWSSSQPGQLNRFRAASSCLYLSRITGDEKKNVFVASAPASLFQIKSCRDPSIKVEIHCSSSFSTWASDYV